MQKQKPDLQIKKLIQKEQKRVSKTLQLIPSENFTSKAVREVLSSVLVHKYSEGQVGKRYYEGNEYIDEVEKLAKKRALKAFDLNDDWHVNVQAYSGSIANLAVYNALLKPGEKIMSMYLTDGGHLSHGWQYKGKKISLSSKIYNVAYYHVDPQTGKFDYEEVATIAKEEKPQMIISGGTAYPREIDYKALSRIAQEIGAYYMADIAHEAGLVAGEVSESPFPYADVVTMTTHKTLRGPRGALIFCRKKYAEEIDRSVFPGIQGGPHNHTIGAIAVCLEEANKKAFKDYANRIVKNAKALADELKTHNFKLVSDGTDKHLILIDLRNKKINGTHAAKALQLAGITLNKNTIPGEPGSPFNPSGIRLGTPTVTTQGMKEAEMKKVAKWINEAIELARPFTNLAVKQFETKVSNHKKIKRIRSEVKSLCKKFPPSV